MGTICLQCGDRGFTNAFVYCIKCLDVAVHRYCLDIIPETFDEFVHWVCDDCDVEVQDQSAVHKRDPIPLQTRDLTFSKHIDGLSRVGTKRNEIVVVQAKEHGNKDVPEQSYEACRKLDLVERDESSSDIPLMQLARFKYKNKQAKDNRMQQAKLSTDTLMRNKDKKRSITSAAQSDDNMKRNTNKKKSIPESNQSYCERVNIGVNESASLACDSTLATKARENKSSESRNKKCIPGKPFSSDKNPHMTELCIISCNGSLKSPKKNKTEGLNLEIQFADMSTVGRNACPSNDHIENKESEYRNYEGFSNGLVVSSAEPVVMPIWRGCFNIWNKELDILDGLMAHLSSKACQKVYDAACEFQPVLELEMLPRSDVWPKSFEISEPNGDNIALYFFPSKISERVFDRLVEKMMGEELALKAIMQNAELLIFTSTELPLLYWRFQGKHYLWGVFRGKQNPPSQSNSCAVQLVDSPTIHTNPSSNHGKIHVTTRRCGDRSPVSPLSNASSYGSGAF